MVAESAAHAPEAEGGRDGTLWYYRSLVVAFQNAGSNAIVEELERVVCEVERRAAVVL